MRSQRSVETFESPPRYGKTKVVLEQVERALATGKRVLFFLGDQLEAEPVSNRGANAVHNVALAKLLATYPNQFIIKSIADLRKNGTQMPESKGGT